MLDDFLIQKHKSKNINLPWPHSAKDGVYTYGLFFEACRWDWTEWKLAESEPKVLYATWTERAGGARDGNAFVTTTLVVYS